jgi:ribonuclease G
LRDETKQIVIDDEAQFQRAVKFTQAFMPGYVERIVQYDGRKPIFEQYGIEAALRTALHRHVPLESGGSLVFDQGEALTAIDVNTGSFVGKSDLEDTITKNNMEACRAVAHQLRLRNLGGIIVVDFVDMDKSSNRKQVWDEFNKALALDRARSNVTKISELGLVEMTRKRTRESLHQLLTEPCPACEGKGVVKSPTTVAYDILRDVRRVGATVSATEITVECTPNVADLLQKYEREYLDGLEKRFHKKVVIKASKTLAPDQYKLAGKVVKDVEPAKKPRSSGRARKRTGKTKSTRGKTDPTHDQL